MKSAHGTIWEKSGGMCYICGLPMGRKGRWGELLNFTVDHWHPRSKGGTNDDSNLKGTHKLCNSQKGNKLPSQLDEKFIGSCQWQIRKLLKGWME